MRLLLLTYTTTILLAGWCLGKGLNGAGMVLTFVITWLGYKIEAKISETEDRG